MGYNFKLVNGPSRIFAPTGCWISYECQYMVALSHGSAKKTTKVKSVSETKYRDDFTLLMTKPYNLALGMHRIL